MCVFADSELAHLNGPGLSAVLADGNQAWIQNTTFVSIDSPSPGAVIKADFDGSAVALTDVNFEVQNQSKHRTTDTVPLHTMPSLPPM